MQKLGVDVLINAPQKGWSGPASSGNFNSRFSAVLRQCVACIYHIFLSVTTALCTELSTRLVWEFSSRRGGPIDTKPVGMSQGSDMVVLWCSLFGEQAFTGLSPLCGEPSYGQSSTIKKADLMHSAGKQKSS